ncbi:Paired amphipathic helix protein Sin3b [Globodera pallida]|nr:Paired amphipathic helix protein Sin3b [Globodera pallida]
MSHSHFPSLHGNATSTELHDVAHHFQSTAAGHVTSSDIAVRVSGPTSAGVGHHHTTFVPPHGSTASQQIHQQQQHSQLVQTQQQELTASTAALLYQQNPLQQVPVAQTQVQPSVKSRKLQVDDALSYLEKVRQQFSNDPQVYNDFLEVMKEFKSHTIDTNGVIRRVSHLFQAYPELIDGFNTFLPHGYEVRVHGNHIFIFEPNGSSSLINNTIGDNLMDTRMDVVAAVASPQMSSNSSTLHPIQSQSVLQTPSANEPAVAGQPVKYVQINQQREKQSSQDNIQQQKVVVSGVEQNVLQQTQQQPNSKTGQQPIHFNEALGYLNRIKERFADKPDVYREFLNILGNYQQCEGDQKWSEAEVYQRVSRLFHNELDLMRDFKSFLPDAKLDFSEQQNEQQKPKLEEVREKQSSEHQQQMTVQTQSSNSKPMTTSTSAVASKKQIGKEQSNLNAKKAKAPVSKMTYAVSVPEILEEIPLKDFVIFEKIHRALQSETVFENFIRTLALYNKNLVSRSELTDLVTPFLAEHPELLKQFKDILGGLVTIGLHPRKQRPLEDRLPQDLAEHIDYNTCKQHGVSYRCLPEDANRPVCSGRTSLCDKVLNNLYVSFPKWSSEDSAPITSKKSPFEELMYRTEDERFEVDIFIEVNLAAITALEYARRKIEPLGHEDAKKFMADADLGCSTTFLARAVKKLYGEHGGKILFALKENPLVAVPMVLRRLREKDVECRGLRKEYNEIWRDQVEKNYLKSLDHQALTFKANDVKDIRSKGFILQLENIYDENLRKAIDAGQNEMDGGPQVAIEYPSDQQVFHEANELLLHYIKRQPNIPKKEKGKIKELLHSVVPKLFMLQIALAVGADNEEVETSERSEDESEPTKSDEKAGGDVERQRSTRLRRGRQRRQSLQNEEEAKKNPNSDGAVRVDPETASPSSHYVVRRSDEAHRLDYVLFYGTNPWVLFIRLYAIMCERLAKIKKRTEELVEEYQVELTIREKQKKLYEEKGDSVEAQLMNAVDVHLGLRDLKKPLQNPENFYQIMLQEMKNLLDGQIEASKFEDTLRSMFDTRAYVLFTMDKLVNTLVRQLQNFVGDTTSGQCIDLFNSYFEQRVNGCERGQDAAHVDQDYSVALEKVLLNQHCFKMYFFNRDHPVVTIELIDTDETDSESNDEEEESANVVALQNWEEYLKEESWDLNDSFSNEKSTRPKLLARNVRYRRILAKFLQNSFGAASVAGQSPNKNYSEEPPTNKKMLHFYVSNGLTQFFDGFEPILLVRKSRNRKAFRKKSIASAKKFHNWLDKFHTDDTELSARWMTTGCTSRPCQHHEFKFLRFNIYSSKDADE